MDHQIMRTGFQHQHLVIRNDARLRHPLTPRIGERCHHGGGCKGSVNLDESFLDVVGQGLVQEQRRCTQGAGAVAGKRRAVDQIGQALHGADLGGTGWDCKPRCN